VLRASRGGTAELQVWRNQRFGGVRGTAELNSAVGVDIAGTGINGAQVDGEAGQFAGDRVRPATPSPATPAAAGITSVRFGAAQGRQGIGVFITLGTCIGSTLFANGTPVPTSEIGHLHLHHKDAESELRSLSASTMICHGRSGPSAYRTVSNLRNERCVLSSSSADGLASTPTSSCPGSSWTQKPYRLRSQIKRALSERRPLLRSRRTGWLPPPDFRSSDGQTTTGQGRV